jgi:TIR domain
MAGIYFIYRRPESQEAVTRLNDLLHGQFSRLTVFPTFETIPFGGSPESVTALICDELRKSAVILVVIGPNWLHATDVHGQRRIDDPTDFFRLELELALESRIPLIPLFIDSAIVPEPKDLPASLRELLFRPRFLIRPAPDFNSDFQRLVPFLRSLLQPTDPVFRILPGSPTVGAPAPPPRSTGPTTVACEMPQDPPSGISMEDTATSVPSPAERRTGSLLMKERHAPVPCRRGDRRGGLWARLFGWLRFGQRAHDPVDAAVFAPPAVRPGQRFLVAVFAHLPTKEEEAIARALEFDEQAKRRGVTTLEIEVGRGERLTFHLSLPGLEIDSPKADLIWRGLTSSVQFGVRVPDARAAGTMVGTVTASLQSIPVGHVKFKLDVLPTRSLAGSAEPIATGESASHYRHAFISYASGDRHEVLKRVQMLARLRIRFFQDVLDLDPGVRWERELYRKIDQSDLFLLFWSAQARESKWVLEEVRYALSRKSGNDSSPPEILPIVLEGPPPPPPPDELAHLHFNDYLLYLMQEPKKQR